MNFKDIKSLSVSELNKKKATLQSDLFNARMKNSLGQLSNPLEIRKMRKDVARIMTVLSQNSTSK